MFNLYKNGREKMIITENGKERTEWNNIDNYLNAYLIILQRQVNLSKKNISLTIQIKAD